MLPSNSMRGNWDGFACMQYSAKHVIGGDCLACPVLASSRFCPVRVAGTPAAAPAPMVGLVEVVWSPVASWHSSDGQLVFFSSPTCLLPCGRLPWLVRLLGLFALSLASCWSSQVHHLCMTDGRGTIKLRYRSSSSSSSSSSSVSAASHHKHHHYHCHSHNHFIMLIMSKHLNVEMLMRSTSILTKTELFRLISQNRSDAKYKGTHVSDLIKSET